MFDHYIITTQSKHLNTLNFLNYYTNKKMDNDNIRMAFKNVKKDMMEIKDQLLTIAERQERLEATLEEAKKKEQELVQIRNSPKKTKSEKKSSKK